ncbi:MAG: transcription termination/antitermination NusG family protein [Bryobacteraceae bacterium]|jgi:transcription antitermination factor NusG
MIEVAWYAVAVRSNFERIVAQSLRQKDYEVLLPAYVAKRRWSDRTKVVECALFPGYLFCRMDLRQRVPLLNTPGVASIVGVGKCAAPVPESEIAAIRKMIESGLPVAPWPFLKAGQFVYINRGPLAGVEGMVIAAKNRSRLVVSVEMLRRSVTVEIESDWAQPSKPAYAIGRECTAA